MKRVLGFVAALAFLAPTLALADDITGYWRGWSCGVNGTYGCPATTDYYDNLSTLHFAADPKTGTNTAVWDYTTTSGYYCTSTLTYVSDFGGAVAGAYHYWTFTDVPQTGGCLEGSVVVVFKAGSTDPIQVWWYENNAPAYTDTNTFGYLPRLSRGL